jgi:hypothetical protein
MVQGVGPEFKPQYCKKKKKKKERKKRKRKKGGLGRMREWRGGGTNNVYTCK